MESVPATDATMEASSASGVYDLLILTDATQSMQSYLRALNNSLPEIIRLSALTGCFSRIGVVAYRDYCGGEVLEWSKWFVVNDEGAETPRNSTVSKEKLLEFVKRLRPNNGGDWPEATKSGLATANHHMRPGSKTVVLLYTDAPPHTAATGGRNREAEAKWLRSNGGEYGRFVDLVGAADTLHEKAQVFSIVQSDLVDTLGPYTYLAARTNGLCLQMSRQCGSTHISKITIDLLLAWMGVSGRSKSPATDQSNIEQFAKLCKYKDSSSIQSLSSENDQKTDTYWVWRDTKSLVARVSNNLDRTAIQVHELEPLVITRDPVVMDFTKRYRVDAAYRDLVADHLMDIIRADVSVVTVNDVFGSLWRAVCNDRTNDARDPLVNEFGHQVNSITDTDKKAAMKKWLDASYDYAAEVKEAIDAVPQADRYPCVFLDPTLDFQSLPSVDGQENVDNPAKFTRDELLEIGRSCDRRILRRLGRVLTCLTFVASEADLPAHIKNQSDKVARIPLALAKSQHKRKFWKVLLHTLLPGTMLAPRPAALLAALALRMGIQPLQDVADMELLNWRDNWNTIDIPETWNTNCLSLILEADFNYSKRAPKLPNLLDQVDLNDDREARETRERNDSVLTHEDRRLFQTLVDYKLLDMNMATTLTAAVGWQPDKTKSPMGPVVTCKSCHFPRSVTIMAADGICGLCDKGSCDCASPQAHEGFVNTHVSKDDNAKTKIDWVECSVLACRAQYVVYNEAGLRVRAKCFYCRRQNRLADDLKTPIETPFVECRKCCSRIVYPVEYRPAELDCKDFTCPACEAGVQTIVHVETTAKELRSENGMKWLLRNDDEKIIEPLIGRSLFYTISSAGIEGFADRVEILPSGPAETTLTLRQKPIQNVVDLLTELHGWIKSRDVQSGSCSLCFQDSSKRNIMPACGRRGCAQLICNDCRQSWYSLNKRGHIINVAALNCPFCRRLPAPSTISFCGTNTLGDLRRAVDEAGEWIYAWCQDCGFARPYAQRECARGAPTEVAGWICELCQPQVEIDDPTTKTKALKCKECPGCGTMTEKIDGCDHITCPNCPAHWCFNCGLRVDRKMIYKHMEDKHGGIYGDWDEDDY